MTEHPLHRQWFAEANRLQAAGRLTEAISLWQQLLRQAPHDWQARLNLASAQQQSGDYEAALEGYLAVLAQQPQALGARVNLAQLLKVLGEYALAHDLLQEVLQQQPDHVEALAALALVQGYLGQNDAAVDSAWRAWRLAPQRPALAANLGLLLTQARRYDEAEQVLSDAIRHFGALPALCWNRAIVRLYQGDYLAAWPDYEARFDCVLAAQHEALPRLTLSPPPAGRVLLWAEQGLGDSIMVMRLLPRLAQLGVVCDIEAPAALHPLLAQLLPQARLLTQVDERHYVAQLPLMSLPGLLQLACDDIPRTPYLQAETARLQPWVSWLSARRSQPRAIGLVWSSGAWGVGAADYNRQRKSLAPEQLLPLLAQSGIDWVALQQGALPPPLQGRLHHAGEQLHDFADTAAVLAGLDLLITVDTAVAHLAAAMGKPVWLLMRYEGAPFFGAADEAPWYRQVTVLREQQPGQWDEVLSRCITMLN
ncbi:tetratricopeptide repeat protein [Vogesella indigofera]|uniref:Tetratricopeptide repeat protein n=1 Tax=Vogesella indigofera TaxID=45465 RepID=A0ABT5I709_VOGIN|nr:tetratricopeptide repeat protein [Vogesella indigofera]MDC7691959.1 tetratricopeptide repeat protein [Vogesella indigofera]